MGSKYEVEREAPVWQNVVLGVAIGFVIGGAIALLLAPKSGDKLRADLADAVDDLKDKAEEMVDTLQDSTATLVEKSKTVIDQTRENLVRSVEAGKEAYDQTRQELTSQLQGK